MPLNLGDLGFTALDLEIRDYDTLFADENDSWEICCNCKNHVEVVVGP
jgi:hypothetical protein